MDIRAYYGTVLRHLGLRSESVAMLVASWTLAAGLAAGTLIAGFVAAGLLHPDGVIAVGVALLGSAFGAVHGVVLGRLGRAPGPGSGGWRDGLASGLAAVVAAPAAATGSLWLEVSAATAGAGSGLGWAGLIVGGLLSLGIFAWATILGWRAFERAYARWPDHRLGGLLVGGAFVLLAGAFLLLRPVLPGTALQVSPLGGIVLAALATLWVALPAVVIALRVAHSR